MKLEASCSNLFNGHNSHREYKLTAESGLQATGNCSPWHGTDVQHVQWGYNFFSSGSTPVLFPNYSFQYTNTVYPQMKAASSFLLRSSVQKHHFTPRNISVDDCYFEKQNKTRISEQKKEHLHFFQLWGEKHTYSSAVMNIMKCTKDKLEWPVILFSLGDIWLQ